MGIGIDIVKIDRIKKILESPRCERFCKKIFTSEEMNYAAGKRDPHIHFSGFFAVKESFMKALGEGWRKGLKFSEIQVFHNNKGAPYLKLEGKTGEYLRKMNLTRLHVSITHEADYAIGMVIIEG
ncbi:holo-ACP synthase [bacterium]|nr:holo-ACP synthase [bacterium]